MTYQVSTDPQRWSADAHWLVYCGQSGSIVARGLDRDEAEALCRRLNTAPHPDSIIRELECPTVH